MSSRHRKSSGSLSKRKNPNTHKLLDQWEKESVTRAHLRVGDCEALMFAASTALQTRDRYLKARVRRLLSLRHRTAPRACVIFLLPLADLVGGFTVALAGSVCVVKPEVAA